MHDSQAATEVKNWRTTSVCFYDRDVAQQCVDQLTPFLKGSPGTELRVRDQPDKDGWWWLDECGPMVGPLSAGTLAHIWSSAHYAGQWEQLSWGSERTSRKNPENVAPGVRGPAGVR